MKIDHIVSGEGIGKAFTPSPSGPTESPATSFSKVFGDMVQQVNTAQQQSDQAIQALASGESKGLHEVMIAMEKSSVSFQFLAQVKTKVVDAYQEIMRMPV